MRPIYLKLKSTTNSQKKSKIVDIQDDVGHGYRERKFISIFMFFKILFIFSVNYSYEHVYGLNLKSFAHDYFNKIILFLYQKQYHNHKSGLFKL